MITALPNEPAKGIPQPDATPSVTGAGSILFPRGPVLIEVCAWCQSVLGFVTTKQPRTDITHGICRSCCANARKGIADYAKEKQCAA